MSIITLIYIGKKNSNSRLSRFIKDFQLDRVKRKRKREKIKDYPVDLLIPPEEDYIRNVSLWNFIKGSLRMNIWRLNKRD